jgi:hypothetical protein
MQDYEIECPDTKSLFSLKTGEITSWWVLLLRNHSEGWHTTAALAMKGAVTELHGCLVCRYPTNPVLRVITPRDTVRDLDIYPVQLTQDAILVDVTGAASTKYKSSRGGSDTSIDNNNVFAIQPRVYVEDADPNGEHFLGLCVALDDSLMGFVRCAGQGKEELKELCRS